MKHIKKIFEANGGGKVILVKADTNDADYITERNSITDAQIEEIMPMIEALRNFKINKVVVRPDGSQVRQRHNWPAGDSKRFRELSPQEMYGHVPGFDLFSDFVPYGEYGIHTIESVEILSNPIRLF